jgi:hypothetical protein
MTKHRKPRRDEKSLRETLEGRRGDMSLYESKPERVKVGSGAGSIVFSLRFSPTELDDLRFQAEARGITLSEMIRKAALDWGQSHRYQIIVQPQPTIEISMNRTRSLAAATAGQELPATRAA